MDEAHELSRRVGDLIDAEQLRPKVLRRLADSQQPPDEALLDICMHQDKRRVAMAPVSREESLGIISTSLPSHITLFQASYLWR